MRVATVGIVAAVAGGLALDQAGFFPRSWVWGAVVWLWLAAVAVVLRESIRVTRSEVVWVGALVALLGWTTLTTVWSRAQTQSVLEARRDLVYVGCAAAVVLLFSRRAASLFPYALFAATTGVLLASLAHYFVAPVKRRVVPFEGALLSWPLGYANGVAALAAIATPLALATAAHARDRAARIGGALSIPALVAALVFTDSRGGAVAAAASAAALVAFDPRRHAVLRAIAALLPAVAVAAVTADRSNLIDLTLSGAALRHGRWIGVAGLAAGAFLAVGAIARLPPERRGRRSVPSRGWTLVAVAIVLAAAVVIAVLPRVGADARLASFVGNERAAYWDVAWTQIDDRPALGTGAGTFGAAWVERGNPQLGGALDAHNLYLETLAELGPLGLALLLVALGLPLLAAPAAARHSRLGAAAAAGYVAFLVHAFVDWDWELPAVTTAAIALGGATLVLARRPRERRELRSSERVAIAVAALVLGAAALIGLTSDATPAATAVPSPAAAARSSSPR